ncbi:MAG: MBL fold metallo-hydrolase [Burkholderiaceae bacterium]
MARESKRVHPYREPVSPRPAATVLLMRDAGADFEILMTRRSPTASFAPGAFVFPGGALDAADGAARAQSLARFRASQGEQLRAFSIAAIREAFEELGILLAYGSDGRLVRQDTIERLDRDDEAFFDQIEAESLLLAGDSMHWYCHWVTDPDLPKRFDVRFLVARVPDGQSPVADEAEQFEPTWISPREALDGHESGRIPMIFPTIRTLRRLAEVRSVEEVFAQCGDDAPLFFSAPRGGLRKGEIERFSEHESPYGELELVCPDGQILHSLDWQHELPVKLTRNIQRLTAPNPGVMTGPGTNTYIVGDANAGYAVIDPGPDDPVHVERIAKIVGDKLRYIICTHSHPDHSPGAEPLKALAGGTIMGRPTAESVRELWPFDPEHVLEDGERIQVGDSTLRVLHTPGHQSNHVCLLLEEDRLLFTGDHIMNGSTVVISPPDGDMHAYMKALERLREEPVDYILPAHGHVLGAPVEAIDGLIAHRLGRERKVLAGLDKVGPGATIDKLLPVVYDDVPTALHPVAARSLRAHLDKLVVDGRARIANEAWTLVA